MKLAFTGFKGSGKDYFKEILENNYDFKTFSFSDQLKYLATKIYPWIKFDYPHEKKEISLDNEYTNYSPREIWTTLDTLKVVEPNIFVRMCDEQIKNTIFKNKNILIKDIRNPNEFEYCRKNGYTIIFLNSERFEYSIKYNKDPETGKKLHISESHYETFRKKADYEFFNSKNGKDDFLYFFDKNIISKGFNTNN